MSNSKLAFESEVYFVGAFVNEGLETMMSSKIEFCFSVCSVGVCSCARISLGLQC